MVLWLPPLLLVRLLYGYVAMLEVLVENVGVVLVDPTVVVVGDFLRDRALTNKSPIALFSWFWGFSSLKKRLLWMEKKLLEKYP